MSGYLLRAGGAERLGVLAAPLQAPNPFYFDDTQVVLEASHGITSYPSIH
jgi:hypothetical protein